MSELRRDFELPEFDQVFLDARGLPWEAVLEGGVRWLVLHDYPVASGYNATQASVALQLPASYPDTQIDMVYFFPHLGRKDGKAIGRLENQSLGGKVWQRWSRHRTQVNPWRRGYDCVDTHLLLVDEWLEREVRRAA